VEREIVVHSLQQAVAACAIADRLKVSLTLASAPGAALNVGPGWFKAVIEQASERYPAVTVTSILDCGDEPGAVMAALRAGVKHLRFHGGAETRRKLAEMGAIFVPAAGETLDLLEIEEPETACAAFLRGD